MYFSSLETGKKHGCYWKLLELLRSDLPALLRAALVVFLCSALLVLRCAVLFVQPCETFLVFLRAAIHVLLSAALHVLLHVAFHVLLLIVLTKENPREERKGAFSRHGDYTEIMGNQAMFRLLL